jgi:hypothetical protein
LFKKRIIKEENDFEINTVVEPSGAFLLTPL